MLESLGAKADAEETAEAPPEIEVPTDVEQTDDDSVPF